MELTVEQALQQGVAAHKEGKLQDAERLYRATAKNGQKTGKKRGQTTFNLTISDTKIDTSL